MIEKYIPWIPYKLVGEIVVTLLLICISIVLAALIIFAMLFVWVRLWAAISNHMYRNYDIHPESARPPVWRLQISGIALAMSRFKFKKIPAAYTEAKELTENDETVRDYLISVFDIER